ncbi:MAG: DUF1552 domain-containing protein [Pseudomonadales bacterium]|jgi:hypothetical protein|nr:DUF1552 domain-containing protein [Pseudomonadales bacterium]
MFITQKHLSRRTLLRGAGVSVALPWLDAMTPALAQAAAPKPRLSFIYIPHGATMSKWTPEQTGKNFTFSEILSPLEPYRDYLNVISGLANEPVGPWAGEDSGGAQNHSRAAAAFLTAAHPVKGDKAFVGESLDQAVAQALGQDTPLPSLELAIEPSGLTCGTNFTCAYSNTLAWKTPTLPLPMENNPQLVFERLFGEGATDAQRRERRQLSASMLDSIREQVGGLNKALPAADRSRLDDYLQEVREIERRVHLVDARLSADLDLPAAPTGVPRDFEAHVELMFDLQVLAFKSEITRISTMMLSRENSNTRYPGSGVEEGFHNASHHSNEQKNKDRFAVINRYHITVLKQFFDRLAATPDGDGTLLDNSLVLYGSSLSDANEHNFAPLPVLLMGKAGGLFEGNRHLRFPEHTPLGNLHLSVLEKLGVHRESFGNSTGLLDV